MNDDETKEQPKKILIEDSSDFNLYAAYLAYSKAWADNPDETIRHELNNIMRSLEGNEVSYPTFYRKIDQYRNAEQQFKKPFFKAKKKRAWRRRAGASSGSFARHAGWSTKTSPRCMSSFPEIRPFSRWNTWRGFPFTGFSGWRRREREAKRRRS